MAVFLVNRNVELKILSVVTAIGTIILLVVFLLLQHGKTRRKIREV